MKIQQPRSDLEKFQIVMDFRKSHVYCDTEKRPQRSDKTGKYFVILFFNASTTLLLNCAHRTLKNQMED